jgi:SAM-dependent methyltransferase
MNNRTTAEVDKLTRLLETPKEVEARLNDHDRVYHGPRFSAQEAAVAAFWDNSYTEFGPMWGCEPSQTAVSLIALFNRHEGRFGRRIEIAEIGCGYGRDAFAFAKEGFEVLALDVSRHGLLLANRDYRNASRIRFPGSIRFLHGTVVTLAAAIVGKLDGLSSHRTLHLMQREEVLEFARWAAALVRPGGFISIGARSPRDFNPQTMEWIEGREGQTARYKDPSRHGQLLTFVDEPLLRLTLEPHFTVQISEGIEHERCGNGAVTKLIYTTGTRRAET